MLGAISTAPAYRRGVIKTVDAEERQALFYKL
jgi:hypothetical protein